MGMTQMMKMSYEQELSGNLQLGWTQLEKMVFYESKVRTFFFGSEKNWNGRLWKEKNRVL
jgi:hypothetical protein